MGRGAESEREGGVCAHTQRRACQQCSATSRVWGVSLCRRTEPERGRSKRADLGTSTAARGRRRRRRRTQTQAEFAGVAHLPAGRPPGAHTHAGQ
eukprot:3719058-Prymnesium_polylepis.1